MTDTSTLTWYDENAARLAPHYEAAEPAALHQTLARWIRRGMFVVELGCGSGRDARFMASLGAHVTATDGSAAMIAEAKRLGGAPEFLRLTLPATRSQLIERGLAANSPDGTPCDGRFDAVVSVAMLMHLSDEDCFLTARNITELCREGGLVLISFTSDHPAEPRRFFASRTAQEVSMLFEDFGFTVVELETTDDAMGRSVTWHSLVLCKESKPHSDRHRLQSVLFEDRKTATYKLALLRALCDVAQTTPALQFLNEAEVALPLGLVIERWIAYYWPLIGLPQLTGARRMEFEAGLADLSRLFSGDYFAFRRGLESDRLDATAVKALQTVATVITKALRRGPIEHSGSASGDPTFSWMPAPKRRDASPIISLTHNYGLLIMAGGLWREFRENGLWFADSVLLQWAELVNRFTAGKVSVGDVLARLLATQDSERNTQAARLLYSEKPNLTCVWSDKPLVGCLFEVDHILPWALTRSNDLWNLMPAAPRVNHEKSDRIPAFEFFLDRKPKIIENWRWLEAHDPVAFRNQAAHSLLATDVEANAWWDPMFDAVGRRLETLAQRLAVPRWNILSAIPPEPSSSSTGSDMNSLLPRPNSDGDI